MIQRCCENEEGGGVLVCYVRSCRLAIYYLFADTAKCHTVGPYYHSVGVSLQACVKAPILGRDSSTRIM